MNLYVEHIDDALVVCPRGSSTAPMRRIRGRRARAPGDGTRAADTGPGGAGLYFQRGTARVLVAAQKARELGIVLILCGLSGAVHEVFEVSGFLDILPIREDRTCALNVKAPLRAASGA